MKQLDKTKSQQRNIIYKKNQVEMTELKNTVTEIQNKLERFTSRMNMTEERW